jgi:transcriptional regulator with XRE-family HTH domain
LTEADDTLRELKEIGARLLVARKTLGLSTIEAARVMGVTANTLRKWERGGITARSLNFLDLFCEAFNISLEWMDLGRGKFLTDFENDLRKYDLLSDAGPMTSSTRIRITRRISRLHQPEALMQESRRAASAALFIHSRNLNGPR